MLSSENISLIPVTNQTILDQVLSNNTLSWNYFDYRHLAPKWFGERLQLSLDAFGPRYNGEFNVNTVTEKQLNIFLCNNSAVAQINKAKNEVIEQIKHSQHMHPDCREPLQRIISIIVSISDVSRATISDCLLWPEILKKECADEFSLIRNLITEKKRLFETAEETDNQKMRSNLSKEIYDLEYLIDITNSIGLDLFDRTLLQSKVVIVSGEAGVGKSQLLANAAEQLNKEGQFALLMLGNGFLSTETIAIQITQQLEVDFSFQALLYKLEMLGTESNCNTCLLFDAINESPYRDIWKTILKSNKIYQIYYTALPLSAILKEKRGAKSWRKTKT